MGAHASHKGEGLSLVSIRIASGRRHQIRSHLTHIGHPTVRDGRYSALATFQSDEYLCTQNFLHRYRLAFKDSAGGHCEAMEPLPPKLIRTLGRLHAKDGESARAVHLWLSGLGL